VITSEPNEENQVRVSLCVSGNARALVITRSLGCIVSGSKTIGVVRAQGNTFSLCRDVLDFY
jgi:hypothetical protein